MNLFLLQIARQLRAKCNQLKQKRNKHRNSNEIIDKLILIVTYGKHSQVYTKAESDEKYSVGNVS